jgi:hypothetical protein
MAFARFALAPLLVLALVSVHVTASAQGTPPQDRNKLRSYKTTGEVDPGTVRVVVGNLGAGRYVSVRNRERKLTGQITNVGDGSFTFKPDRGAIRAFRASPEMDIAYGDVLEIKRKMTKTTATTIAIGVAIGVAVLVATTVSFD